MKKLSPLSPAIKGHIEVTYRDFGTMDKMIVSRYPNRHTSARLICELDNANEIYTVREFDGSSWHEVTTRNDEKRPTKNACTQFPSM